MTPPALTPGTHLGPFEILSALGEGGMGAVYRARDTKLNREVAIKVLLPAVANDAERLARFSREAQVLASLNHSNIAHIHGLEESDGVRALVMELVALFQTHIVGGGVDTGIGRQYDVTRDGRFLINSVVDEVTAPIALLQNWRPPAK